MPRRARESARSVGRDHVRARFGESIEFEQTVSSLAFSPDGATLAVGLVSGDVRLVDVAQHAVLPTRLGGAMERVTALAFDVSGDRLYVGRGGLHNGLRTR